MERLDDGIWRFEDPTGSTAYLIVGERRAAMIDCGMGREAVMPRIREVTELPVSLLLTHAHPDHYGAADEFERVWLHEKDAAVLEEMERAFAALDARPFPRERMRAFADGEVFDLGGRRLLTLPLPGHTPGSCVFADEQTGRLFTGDAIGSGDICLMAVPLALSVAAYGRSLRAFARLAAPYARAEWHAGHVRQAGEAGTAGYNPPRMRVVEDMIALCDEICAGRVEGSEVEERFAPDGRARKAYWGSAGLVWLPERIND